MKLIKWIFGVGFLFCSMAGMSWAEHDVAISTLDENRAPKTEFQCGDTLVVSVDLNMVSTDERVAGFAFTLEYPDAVVSPPSMGTDGLPVNADDISSTFPFLSGSTKTYRAGNTQTGRLSLSAAEVDPNTGGAVAHDDDAQLFTVVFTVKSDAPEGNHQFSLIPTTLNNVDAGWNGEASPVLVGAVPQGDGAFDDLANGAFPTLLPSINKSLSFATTCDVSFPPGDVSGDGNLTSTDALMILSFLAGNDPPANGVDMDVNCSGSVTSVDALAILSHLAGNFILPESCP